MKRKSKAELKEQKRQAIQSLRRRKGWQPPKGMVIYPDRY